MHMGNFWKDHERFNLQIEHSIPVIDHDLLGLAPVLNHLTSHN